MDGVPSSAASFYHPHAQVLPSVTSSTTDAPGADSDHHELGPWTGGRAGDLSEDGGRLDGCCPGRQHIPLAAPPEGRDTAVMTSDVEEEDPAPPAPCWTIEGSQHHAAAVATTSACGRGGSSSVYLDSEMEPPGLNRDGAGGGGGLGANNRYQAFADLAGRPGTTSLPFPPPAVPGGRRSSGPVFTSTFRAPPPPRGRTRSGFLSDYRPDHLSTTPVGGPRHPPSSSLQPGTSWHHLVEAAAASGRCCDNKMVPPPPPPQPRRRCWGDNNHNNNTAGFRATEESHFPYDPTEMHRKGSRHHPWPSDATNTMKSGYLGGCHPRPGGRGRRRRLSSTVYPTTYRASDIPTPR